MKTIKLHLDPIPEHQASRQFMLTLFDELHSKGIPCKLYFVGIGIHERLTEVELDSPADISAEVIQQMEFGMKDIHPELRPTIMQKITKRLFTSLTNNTSTINILGLDISADSKARFGEGIRITNSAGKRYFELPIFNTDTSEWKTTEQALAPAFPTEIDEEFDFELIKTEVLNVLKRFSEMNISPNDFERENERIQENTLQQLIAKV